MTMANLKRHHISRMCAVSGVVFLLMFPCPGRATPLHTANPLLQSPPPQAHLQAQSAQSAILSVLEKQTAAWNRGDIDEFMRGYKDSPETTFISKQVEHGYQAVLQRYKLRYASRAAMGTLHFSSMNVRMLCGDYAMVTGKFHLTRTAAGGGDASGVFSLLFQKTHQGWRILLDHTS